ncbi:MAG TPA: S41 family peptidase [Pyrinomonadaceae bacterium]|nr:S41 family peptidase [Pyrinomonadaceae bacterium]
MKKSISLAVIAILSFAICVQSIGYAQQRQQSPVGSAGRPTSGSTGPARRAGRVTSPAIPLIERDLEEALRVIQQNYAEGLTDYNSVLKSSIIGMLRSLDPHSNYYDKAEYEELRTDQRSEYFGIGASIQNYIIDEKADTFVTATFQNAPASRAQLRFGDRILAVDGVPVTGKASIDVRDKIRGPRGSIVRLTVERAADRKIQTLEITRDVVPQPSVPDAYLLKPGVGYVDMTRGFNYTTSDELEDALQLLRAKGATSLVLDLRNNPGGFLDQAIQVAEIFLPYGQPILTQKGRNGLRDNHFRSQNRSANSVPLVILINESTASASEIVAGAMQDHDRALIVGQTSFGKGLVQSIIPLDSGGGLTLTSAKYYTPSGRLIQRDYSDSGFYDYYTQGGSRRLDQKPEEVKPSGPEKQTDTGRKVYGGGGIAPDETVAARMITTSQRRLLSPLFAFTRELVNGRLPGFPEYRVQGINFESEWKPTDFLVTDELFSAFRDFVAGDETFTKLGSIIPRNREFIEVQLRYNIVTAAYGRQMADRVLILKDDPQLERSVAALPRAKDLAMTASKRQVQP